MRSCQLIFHLLTVAILVQFAGAQFGFSDIPGLESFLQSSKGENLLGKNTKEQEIIDDIQSAKGLLQSSQRDFDNDDIDADDDDEVISMKNSGDTIDEDKVSAMVKAEFGVEKEVINEQLDCGKVFHDSNISLMK